MNLDGYVACICEGSAEQAVMDLLLDEDKLIFNSDKLLDGEIIQSRDGKSFESKYLRKGFKEKITVLRILDSRRENFKLRRALISQLKKVEFSSAYLFSIILLIFSTILL